VLLRDEESTAGREINNDVWIRYDIPFLPQIKQIIFAIDNIYTDRHITLNPSVKI
jgi:hypothetical protein